LYWYDLVTLNRKGGGHEHHHDQCDVMVHMPDNKRGVRRTNGNVLVACGSLCIIDRSTFRLGDIIIV
jgi:hypothetical protein